MSVSIIRDNSHALAASIEAAIRHNAVRPALEAIKDDAEATVRVRTGSLQASGYVALFGEESGYGEAVADALGKNPKAKIFEEVKPERENEGVFSFVVEHSIVNEMGGPHMAPNPAAHQAADHERGRFPARVEKAIAEATR